LGDEIPQIEMIPYAGNTKGGKYHSTIDLLFDWFGLVVLQIKTKIVSCHTADSKPVKQEVNSTVILPPLVFPALCVESPNVTKASKKSVNVTDVFAKKHCQSLID
jgi:hypothetical protein